MKIYELLTSFLGLAPRTRRSPLPTTSPTFSASALTFISFPLCMTILPMLSALVKYILEEFQHFFFCAYVPIY